MRAYKKFLMLPRLAAILPPEDAEKALNRGVDNLMDLAEFALRDRPWALRNARESYLEICLLLYRAIEEAQR